MRHLGVAPAELAGLLLLQSAVYGAAPLCGLWAEGITLTPERRLFAGSAQNTGERPVVRRAVLRLGLVAGIMGGATAVLILAIASPSGPVPFSTAPDGPSFGEVLHLGGGTVDIATPPPVAGDTAGPSGGATTAPGVAGGQVPAPARTGTPVATIPGSSGTASSPAQTPTPHGSAPATPPAVAGSAPTSVPTPGTSRSTSPPRPSPTASPGGGRPSSVPTPH